MIKKLIQIVHFDNQNIFRMTHAPHDESKRHIASANLLTLNPLNFVVIRSVMTFSSDYV